MRQVRFIDLGQLSYRSAWDFQEQLLAEAVARKLRNRGIEPQNPAFEAPIHHLLFVEHPPVYTLGRSGDRAHLLLNEAEMARRGVEFFPINRGGDITFHGPGQLVGYPILDLDSFFNDVHRYVRNLEEVFIRVCADFGIRAGRIEGLTGVWIEGQGRSAKRKICAIGVHLSRWVTLHGWAFNVSPELGFFDGIVPCGIADPDKTVTSLSLELGRPVDLEQVKPLAKRHFAEVFECELVDFEAPQMEVFQKNHDQ